MTESSSVDAKLAGLAREFVRAWWEDDQTGLVVAVRDLVEAVRAEAYESSGATCD